MRDLARIAQRFNSIEIVRYDEALQDQLKALTVEMHSVSVFKRLELDLDKTVLQLSHADTVPGNFYRMARRNGELLGCIYGQAFKSFFSDALMAQVKGVWVAGKHQGSAAFLRLLLSFEEWAKGVGARLIFLDQTTALDMERSMNLFEGCGYRLIGVNTVKEL